MNLTDPPPWPQFFNERMGFHRRSFRPVSREVVLLFLSTKSTLDDDFGGARLRKVNAINCCPSNRSKFPLG